MIGTLLISHGKMAEGMLDSLALIVGVADKVDTASLVAGQDFTQFQDGVVEKIKALDDGDGVLVFVDLYGASPFNASMFSFQNLQAAGTNIRVITGMNLPMVMEAIMTREVMPLAELAAAVTASGKDSVQNPVEDLLAGDGADADDGDY